MPSGFQSDPAFETELAKDPDLQAWMLAKAGEVRDRAASQAHRIMPRKGSGSKQFVVDHHGTVVTVVNTDHGGHLDEWGDRHNPPRAPLRKAARAAGLRLEENSH